MQSNCYDKELDINIKKFSKKIKEKLIDDLQISSESLDTMELSEIEEKILRKRGFKMNKPNYNEIHRMKINYIGGYVPKEEIIVIDIDEMKQREKENSKFLKKWKRKK